VQGCVVDLDQEPPGRGGNSEYAKQSESFGLTTLRRDHVRSRAALAKANDLRACQDVVRQMRRAGVAMPDSLIALAALGPDLLEAGRDSQ
jgi:DNA topoisomerase IB